MKQESGLLLKQFVSCFHADPLCSDFTEFKVYSQRTDPITLQQFYNLIPRRFPPLYEELLLSYRWERADLASFRLLANPPGPDFSGLLAEMTVNKNLFSICLKNGFIQFGFGPGVCYDPVCFDLNGKSHRKNYKAVILDHEEILCNSKTEVKAILADNFENLVRSTVQNG